MPGKQDISGKAVERAANIAQRAVARLKDRMPLGPNVIEFNQHEFDNQLRRAQGQKLLAFMDMIGDETVMENLRRVRSNGTS